MAEFKFVISESETKKSYQKSVDQVQVAGVMGKKIGDEISGDVLGMQGYTLKITGGTDKDGFPMHPSVRGTVKKRIMLAGPPGFHPKIKGQRRRKTVRGDTISDTTAQINLKIVKKGEKSLAELMPQKEKPAVLEKKEAKTEEKKEEKKESKAETKSETKTETKEEKKEEKPPSKKTEEKVEVKKEVGGEKTTTENG